MIAPKIGTDSVCVGCPDCGGHGHDCGDPCHTCDSLGVIAADPFLQAMWLELQKAEAKHAPQNSLHESYAVILEEVDEFWDEVKKQSEARDQNAIRKELVQIATMCWRCSRDVL